MATLHPADTHLDTHGANFDKFGTPEWEEPICPRCEADIIRLFRKVGGTDVRLLRGLEMNSVRRELISLSERDFWIGHQNELAELNSGEQTLHDDDKFVNKVMDEVAESIEQRYGSENLEVRDDYEYGVLRERVAALEWVLDLHRKILWDEEIGDPDPTVI